MATKKKTSRKGSNKKRRPRPDGSPITIGGGGGIGDERRRQMLGNVHCDFYDGDYPEPAGGAGRKKFQHSGWYMQSLKITASGQTLDLTPFVPVDGDCEVKVKCRGFDDDLRIIGKDPFGVEFNTGTYNRVSAGRHENPNSASYVYEVEVKAPGFWFKKEFSENDSCSVRADHVSSRKRTTKSSRAKR